MKVLVTNIVIGEFSVFLLMLLFIRKIPVEDLNVDSNEITESVQMDLEYTNSMVPSINGTKLIEKQLKAIRTQFPHFVESVEYCGKWAVSQLIVSNSVEMDVGDCIALVNNSDYGSVSLDTQWSFGNFHIFKFHMLFNPEKLAPIISELCGASAHPNHFNCRDGDHLQLDGLSETESRYTFSKGYGDCPSGCMYKHFWQFSVTPNGVTLTNEWEVGDKSLDGLY